MLDAISEVGAIDIRARLNVAPPKAGKPYSRTRRRGAILGAALHYNGPRLAFIPNPARELKFVIEVDHPYQQRNLGADALMYHYAVLSDGATYQTRDLSLEAWHCGNGYGNSRHLAIHLPVGQGQQPTSAQWAAFTRLVDTLGAAFNFPRTSVFGHNEYPRTSGLPRTQASYRILAGQSVCPGPILHALLVAYRRAETGNPTRPLNERYVRVVAQAGLTVRQGPGRTYPAVVAVPLGSLVSVDGEKTEADGPWLHLSNGRGFIARWFTEPV